MLPIDDRRSERFNPAIAGRPDLLGGRKSLTVYPGMTGMMENAFINVKGVHHTVTAEVELQDDKTNGVILAQAGYFGGWTLYMKDGKPHHEYNWFALERTNIGGDAALTPASTRSVTNSSPTRPSPARAASRSSASMARRSPKPRFPRLSPSPSPPMKARTWASTPRRMCRQITNSTKTPSPGKSSR